MASGFLLSFVKKELPLIIGPFLLFIQLPMSLSNLDIPPSSLNTAPIHKKALKNRCRERYDTSSFWNEAVARGNKENIIPGILKDLGKDSVKSALKKGFNFSTVGSKVKNTLIRPTSILSSFGEGAITSGVSSAKYLLHKNLSKEYKTLERIFQTVFDKQNYLNSKIKFEVEGEEGDIDDNGRKVKKGEHVHLYKSFKNPFLAFYKKIGASSMGYSKEELAQYLMELSDNKTICHLDEEFNREELGELLNYFKENQIKKEKIKEMSFVDKSVNGLDGAIIENVLFEKTNTEGVKEAVSKETEKICLKSLEDYFLNEFPEEFVNQFLKTRSEITLNKLIWFFLKNTGNDTKKFEEVINHLLKKSEMPHLKTIRRLFELSPVSRSALSMIAPLFNNFKSEKKNISDVKYHLGKNDYKLLHILTERELDDGRFSQDKSEDQSILNFIKIINSSYLFSKNRVRTKSERDKNLEIINKSFSFLKEKMNKILRSIAQKNDCFKLLLTGSCRDNGLEELDFINLLKLNNDVNDILYKSMKFRNSDLNFKALRYDSVWPKTTE